MARGNCILVSTLQASQGSLQWGYIAAAETPSPGTILQIDTSVALKGGRHTYKIYNRDADGDRPAGPLVVLLEDRLQGRLTTTAYAASSLAPLYVPLPGDELNLLVANISGTATIAAGTILSVDDGTGKLIAESGESGPFLLLEDVVDNAADQLAWVRFGGQT